MNCFHFHSKCKAQCCSDLTPLPIETYELNKDKVVNQCINDGDQIRDRKAYRTASGKCCFLNADYSCNIYDHRPDICRKFGDESHIWMTCSWQKKDGSARCRNEKRLIERNSAKAVDRFNIGYSKIVNKNA